jgi:hypothetical protein
MHGAIRKLEGFGHRPGLEAETFETPPKVAMFDREAEEPFETSPPEKNIHVPYFQDYLNFNKKPKVSHFSTKETETSTILSTSSHFPTHDISTSAENATSPTTTFTSSRIPTPDISTSAENANGLTPI